MHERTEYMEKMQRELTAWTHEIDTLEGRISTATGPDREALRSELDKARRHAESAQKKLEELREAGEHTWEKLKEESERAWDDLKRFLESLRTRVSD